MTILTRIPAFIIAMTLGSALAAHEYWIEPLEYHVENGANIVANVKVGTDYKGDIYAYFPENFNSFDVTDSAETRPIEGRIGDMPAINIETSLEGLHVLSQFSSTSKITWDEFAKFESFVRSHGMDWVLGAHAERGLPETGFAEGYTRFVKSLVAVGDGAGADTYGGMFFELVAQANPYTDDMSSGLPVVVLFKNQPLPNTQIHIFYRADPSVDAIKSAVISDANALVTIPNFGDGEYMINAVHMVIPPAAAMERTGVVWHSLWASLTYQFGENP